MTDPDVGPAEDVDVLSELAEALDGADDLDPDARLELLRRVEAGIASALDGLDGL